MVAVHALADPVDAIVLREAALLRTTSPVALLDDQSGALARGLVEDQRAVAVHAYCDSLADERAVALATLDLPSVRIEPALGPGLLDGVPVVLLRLPKSLAALDEIAEAVARWAEPEVQLLAGGRVKHMSRGMNEVLGRHFSSVRASLGSQKSRVLLAHGPRPVEATRYPLTWVDEDLGITVRAHGAVFSAGSVDAGTRQLLTFRSAFPRTTRTAVDLGCGTGVLAVAAAQALPEAAVLAVDDSRAATLSAIATAEANGLAHRIEVRRTHLMEGVPDNSVDLVLCNPPFHRGNTRDSAVAFEMFADAARTLVPGGELWTVYNSHLPYLRTLRRLVGRTEVVGQSPGYTVTRSVQFGR